MVNDCFEFDWSCVKKPKFKASGEEEVKSKCRVIYAFVRQVYRRLAAVGVVGMVFSIGANLIREFALSTIGLQDPVKLKPEILDLVFE